jgi:membrane fusion protein (multidrug efflux system)
MLPLRPLQTVLISLLLAMVAPACSKAAGDSGKQTRPPPLVSVASVAADDVPVEVRAPVELRPLQQANIGSKTLGVLDAVLVDRGDRVKKGQLLAIVRPSDLPDQLAAARGTLAMAQSSLQLARASYERASKLAPAGVVSTAELQSAAAAVAASESQNAAAQAQVSALATRLGEMRLDSPMDGVVAARLLDPGAIVGLISGGTALTIVRTDVLRVFISVPERQIAGITIGKEAHVELDALPGRSFHGKVVRVAPTLDPTTRTLDVEVELPNPTDEMRPGMFGRGSIVVDVRPHVPIVPVVATQISNDQTFVFVMHGDKVERRQIHTGVDLGDRLEVTDGLREGDEIVVAGIDNLADGMVIRPSRDIDPYTGAKAAATPTAATPRAAHD